MVASPAGAEEVSYGPYIQKIFDEITPHRHGPEETTLKRHVPKPTRGRESSQMEVPIPLDDFAEAHLPVLAEIDQFFPEARIAFLHRDYLFADFLAHRLIPGANHRYDRALISRTNSTEKLANGNNNADPTLPVLGYLRHFGVSIGDLNAGATLVLPDTGFRGTIPRYLQSLFPTHLRHQLKSHYLSSSTPEIPESSVFAAVLGESLERKAGYKDFIPLHTTGIYEGIPVPTHGSFDIRLGEDWQPTARENAHDLPRVKSWLEHLAAWADGSHDQFRKYHDYAARMGAVMKADDPEEIQVGLRAIADSAPEGDRKVVRAMVKDALGTLTIYRPELGFSHLDKERVASTAEEREHWKAKAALRAKLEGFARENRWTELQALVDSLTDREHLFATTEVAKLIGAHPNPIGFTGALAHLIHRGSAEELEAIANYAFRGPATAPQAELLSALMDRAHAIMKSRPPDHGNHVRRSTRPYTRLLESLARNVFALPHHADKEDLARRWLSEANAQGEDASPLRQRFAGVVLRGKPSDRFPKMRAALEAAGDPGVFLTLATPGDPREAELLHRALETLPNHEDARPFLLDLLSNPRVLGDEEMLKATIERAVRLDRVFPRKGELSTTPSLDRLLESLAAQPRFHDATSGWPAYFERVLDWLSTPEKHAAFIASRTPKAERPRAPVVALIQDGLQAWARRCGLSRR